MRLIKQLLKPHSDEQAHVGHLRTLQPCNTTVSRCLIPDSRDLGGAPVEESPRDVVGTVRSRHLCCHWERSPCPRSPPPLGAVGRFHPAEWKVRMAKGQPAVFPSRKPQRRQHNHRGDNKTDNHRGDNTRWIHTKGDNTRWIKPSFETPRARPGLL